MMKDSAARSTMTCSLRVNLTKIYNMINIDAVYILLFIGTVIMSSEEDKESVLLLLLLFLFTVNL